MLYTGMRFFVVRDGEPKATRRLRGEVLRVEPLRSCALVSSAALLVSAMPPADVEGTIGLKFAGELPFPYRGTPLSPLMSRASL